MVPQTEADQFILREVQPVLQPGEQVVTCGYLDPVVTGDGRIGTFVNAATRMAAFAALTDRRLILVFTRIGAFKPLLENHGIESLDRQMLRGVSVGPTLHLDFADGRMLEYKNNSSAKHVSTQAELFRQLPQVFGISEAAARNAKSKRLQSVIGTAIGILLAVAYVWYRLH